MRFGAFENEKNKFDAKTWIGNDLTEMRLVDSSSYSGASFVVASMILLTSVIAY